MKLQTLPFTIILIYLKWSAISKLMFLLTCFLITPINLLSSLSSLAFMKVFGPGPNPTLSTPQPTNLPHTEEECIFLLSQRDIEIKADCFSKPFGSEILPSINPSENRVVAGRGRLRQIGLIGFDTGNPRVRFSHTVPEPAYTVTRCR